LAGHGCDAIKVGVVVKDREIAALGRGSYQQIRENPFEEQLLSVPQAPRALFDTFLPLLF
jgi:hypothetical protein